MPDTAEALRSTLGPEKIDIVRRLAQACRRLGCDPYIVGGTVRDALLGRPSGDLDITLVSPPSDFARSLAAALGASVLLESQFGTAKLVLDGSTFDLVAARSESYPSPGSLPVVARGSLEQDLARRDFTINAMAVNVEEGAWGELVDPHGGQDDLEHGLMRVLHPDSFRDDPTRIIRCARYVSRFGFLLEDSTLRHIDRSIEWLAAISSQRFKNELERLFDETNIPGAVEHLSRWHVLDMPGAAFRFDPPAWDAFGRRREACSGEPRLIGWGLLALGHESGQSEAIKRRWGLDSDAGLVSADALRLRDTLHEMDLGTSSPSERVAELEGYRPEAVEALALTATEAELTSTLGDFLARLSSVRPALDGHDLVALGVSQGPDVGEVLRLLRDARLDGEVGSRSEEIALVQRFISTRDG